MKNPGPPIQAVVDAARKVVSEHRSAFSEPDELEDKLERLGKAVDEMEEVFEHNRSERPKPNNA